MIEFRALRCGAALTLASCGQPVAVGKHVERVGERIDAEPCPLEDGAAALRQLAGSVSRPATGQDERVPLVFSHPGDRTRASTRSRAAD